MAPLNRWRALGWGTAAALLLLPLVAMQFTDAVGWSPRDFLAAAITFLAAGLPIELAMRSSRDPAFRAGVALAMLAALLLAWANGAVGLIGSDSNLANLMYAAVLGVAALGSLLAGFRARGMALAMFAAAAGQLVVPVIALAQGLVPEGGGRIVLLATGFFSFLWLGAGVLLRLAASRGERGRGAPA